MSRIKRFICFFAVALVGILLDQYTKAIAVKYLMSRDYPLIKNILEFVYTENRGAAFGILQGQTYIFYIIAAIVSFVLIRAVCIMPETKRMLVLFLTFAFVFSGAAGNIIDRIFRGYVVDFIYFKPIDFPIFNVADMYVSCAVAALIYLLVFYYKEDELDFLSFKRIHKAKKSL